MGCYIDFLVYGVFCDVCMFPMVYSVMFACSPLASASPTCHCGERTFVSVKFHMIISAILGVLQV